MLRVQHHRFAALLSASLIAAVGCRSAERVDDSSLNTAVQSRLAADVAIAGEPIQATVLGGVATLEGAVSSPAARALAARDASQIAGIHSVVNNLTVQAAGKVQSAARRSSLAAQAVPGAHGKPSALIARSENAPVREKSSASVVPPAPTDAPAPIERRPLPPPDRGTSPSAPPAMRTVTVPSGTPLAIRITQTLDSATTQPGDAFSGSLSSDVVIDGVVAFAAGSAVSGRVDAVHEAGHYKGSSLLTISLVTIHRSNITTAPYTKEGSGRGKNTAEKVGGGAAVGAVLGGIFGGGKGAAIGAAAGGGLGAGAQTVTRGQQVQIPSETLLRFTLTSPVDVRASTHAGAEPDSSLPRHPNN